MALSRVQTDGITDSAITAVKIADGTVVAAEIAADAVDGTKIADNTIDSEHYTDGSIDLAHLAADAVDGTKIADNAIDSEHYTDASIDEAHIGNDQVTGAKLNPSFVTGDIIYADGTDTINRLAKPGTPAGEVLTFATSASAPSWAAAGGGGTTFVEQQTASNDATIDLEAFSSHYASHRTFMVTLADVYPATDNSELRINISQDVGSTYLASSYYMYTNWGYDSALNTRTAVNAGGTSYAAIAAGGVDNQGPSGGYNGVLWVFGPGNSLGFAAGHRFITNQHTYRDNTSLSTVTGHGTCKISSAGAGVTMEGLRFAFASGNITTGTFTVHGITDA